MDGLLDQKRASGANPAPVLAAFEAPSPTFAASACAPGEVLVGVHGTTGSPYGSRPKVWKCASSRFLGALFSLTIAKSTASRA